MSHFLSPTTASKLHKFQNQLVHESKTDISLFFSQLFNRLHYYEELEKKLTPAYFAKTELEVLMEENHKLYQDILPAHYGTSYSNPVYATASFGAEIGQIVTFLDAESYKSIRYVFEHRGEAFDEFCQLCMLVCSEMLFEKKEVSAVRGSIRLFKEKHFYGHCQRELEKRFGGKNRTFSQIVEERDFSDLKYLFEFGIYLTDHELRTAAFINSYDEAELNHLAKTVVNAYINGFKRDNKDISLRHAVQIVAVAGQERLTKLFIKYLKEAGLKPFVNEIDSSAFNKQFEFDHKFDQGLYLDQAYNDMAISHYKKAAQDCEIMLRDYSGILYVEKFGEEPFSPINNDQRIKLDKEQQELSQSFRMETSQTLDKYLPETERSFCMVAFPTPHIGEQFEAIFADVVKINQMDSEAHEKIQQVLIDALDLGDFVHIKGYKGNQTDIRVKLPKLANPDKETNFVNCVADVNIPVGEVFTSPMLKGTEGILHLDTVYLDNFNYNNLHLTFEDGNITDYSCSNFEEPEKNREYIRENLLFPHESLPIGEFAIGTNTLAYVISEKYGIVDKLPILIVEKMGPHFAIGDTCFSWAEDNSVYNPTDGKEIMARDNERSILRKEDVAKAYTNCHTDITIPYDSLEHITVHSADGKAIDLIRHGRFVLPGTEVLNEPFDQKI